VYDDHVLLLEPPAHPPATFTVFLSDGRVLLDVLPPWDTLPRWPDGTAAGVQPGVERWSIPGVSWDDEPVATVRCSPSQEVRAYAAAVTGLRDVDLTALSDQQALADLEAMLQSAEHYRAVQVERFVDAQRRNLAHLDNEVSLQTWVRRRFDDTGRADVSLSRRLRHFPSTQAKLRAGELSVEAADLVSATLSKVRSRVDREGGLIDGLAGDQVLSAVVSHVVQQVAGARLGLPDGHPLLEELQDATREILAGGGSQLDKLEAAYGLLGQHVPLAHLKACLLEQHDALLPAALEDRSSRTSDNRGLVMTPNFGSSSGGRVVIDTDDELYELFHAAVGAEARRDPANPEDTSLKADAFGETPGELGADVESQGDVRFPRSTRQRGHDALKLVLHRYLAAGLGGTHDKAPVSVLVTMTASQLEGRSGALPARGASGRPLPSSLLRQWWGDASVTALVLSEGLIPLGITHSGRTLTAAERRASLVQHGHACSGLRCCTPGDPLRSLAPHHVYKFSTFGRTSIFETIWACDRFHMGVHHGETLPLRDGRWLNADGWTDPPH
jgi:hypothetical protein